jgi:ribonucleoside-triphosphate reductase
LGIKARKVYTDVRDNRISPNSKPVYRIDYTLRSGYGELYKELGGYSCVSVVSVKRVKNGKALYCFEVDTDEHLFVLPGGMVTHNCRLRIDLRELLRKTGALFGSGEKTGSIGVVTLNMPRLGYLHQGNEKTFFAALEQLMDDARDSLEIKRKVVERSLNSGLMPYSKEYIGSFDNHFSTIGLVGMNECCLNFMGVNIADPKGKDFAVRVLKFMRDRLSFYQEETKHLYNLEATPAEGTCYRLARADRKAYPDIITAGGDGEPYYTNSTHLPVGYTDDVFKALDHQEELQTIYTGGTVVHVFLGEGIQDPMQCMKLVKKIAETYKIPAFTITPTYSVCPEHGYIKGEHKRCPKCVEVEVSGEEIIKQMKEEGK